MSQRPAPPPLPRPRIPAVSPISNEKVTTQNVYVTPEKRTDFYGVPRLALKIIFANFMLWLLVLAIVYIHAGHPLINLPLVLFAVACLSVLWVVIHFIAWKLYWWMVGLYFSCFSMLLVFAVIALATGAISLASITRSAPYNPYGRLGEQTTELQRQMDRLNCMMNATLETMGDC